MNEIYEFLKEMNIGDSKIDSVDQKLSAKIDDINRRLCRIEESLATQGHCLFQQREQDKKAE